MGFEGGDGPAAKRFTVVMFSDVLFLFYLSQVDFTTSQPDFHAAQQCELRTCELGDDVRRDLVFDESDAVA